MEAPSLLFSNAVIHWLPDHRSLIPRLWSLLPPGGCLAVQAPTSWDLPSAPPECARRSPTVARRARRWATPSCDAPWRAAGLHDPGFYYYDLLATDAAHVDVWDHRVPARPHRHRRRAGVGHRDQPATDPGRPRRCGPGNLPGPVPRAAQARVPRTPRRHHSLPLPPPVLRRPARLKFAETAASAC